MPTDPRDITLRLKAAARGDRDAEEEVLGLVYDELRRLAARNMAKEASDHTLQPTALVHEAYLRLLGGGEGEMPEFAGRGHFFGAAARCMRRILVERARKAQRPKHGGGRARLTFDEQGLEPEAQAAELLALDAALTELEVMDRRKHDVVMLRYFAGLTIEDTARELGISTTTVTDDWSFARLWLYNELRP